MKTDKHNMDLEQLLGTLEHAGRDARRQQELGAMIDRMAATEGSTSRHGFWWWSARVAAAACLIFFISTAVRIWFIPTERGEQLVAENKMFAEDTMSYSYPFASLGTPSSNLEEEFDRADAPLGSSSPTLGEEFKRREPGTLRSSSKLEEGGRRAAVVEEYVVEESVADVEQEESLPVEEPVVVPLYIEEDIAEPVMVVQVESEPSQREQQEPVAVKPQKRRSSLFSGLIRRAEPSKMDGTMLAFNIL